MATAIDPERLRAELSQLDALAKFSADEELLQLRAMTARLLELEEAERSRSAMDNQHRQIKGYRELGADEIALMNEIKEQGVKLGALCAKVADLRPRPYAPANPDAVSGVRMVTSGGLALDADGAVWTDPRWASIAQIHFQEGLMALTRAVARPTFF